MLDIEKLTDAVLAGVKALLAKQTEPLIRQIQSLADVNASLEERLRQLEQQEPAAPFDPAPLYQAIEQVKSTVVVQMPELPDFGSMLEEAIKAIDPSEALVELDKKLAVVEARVGDIRLPEVVNGKDGVGIEQAKINDEGELLLKLTNGETLRLGRVKGQDALPIQGLSVDYDGLRTISLKLGDTEQKLKLPVPIDRGVYRDDENYEKGDSVSWAGSLWIAQVDDPQGKPEQSPDWRLAVKRGRDAKPVVKP